MSGDWFPMLISGLFSGVFSVFPSYSLSFSVSWILPCSCSLSLVLSVWTMPRWQGPRIAADVSQELCGSSHWRPHPTQHAGTSRQSGRPRRGQFYCRLTDWCRRWTTTDSMLDIISAEQQDGNNPQGQWSPSTLKPLTLLSSICPFYKCNFYILEMSHVLMYVWSHYFIITM